MHNFKVVRVPDGHSARIGMMHPLYRSIFFRPIRKTYLKTSLEMFHETTDSIPAGQEN